MHMPARISSLTPALQALPRLRQLGLVNVGLTGTLPAEWATLFPELRSLHLVGNQLQGPLLTEWLLSPTAFPRCLPAATSSAFSPRIPPAGLPVFCTTARSESFCVQCIAVSSPWISARTLWGGHFPALCQQGLL